MASPLDSLTRFYHFRIPETFETIYTLRAEENTDEIAQALGLQENCIKEVPLKSVDLENLLTWRQDPHESPLQLTEDNWEIFRHLVTEEEERTFVESALQTISIPISDRMYAEAWCDRKGGVFHHVVLPPRLRQISRVINVSLKPGVIEKSAPLNLPEDLGISLEGPVVNYHLDSLVGGTEGGMGMNSAGEVCLYPAVKFQAPSDLEILACAYNWKHLGTSEEAQEEWKTFVTRQLAENVHIPCVILDNSSEDVEKAQENKEANVAQVYVNPLPQDEYHVERQASPVNSFKLLCSYHSEVKISLVVKRVEVKIAGVKDESKGVE